MRASAADAVAAARGYTSYQVGYCLRWVVTCWAAPSIGCPDAITSWEWAIDKHPNDRNPPPGAPVYYRGGRHGHIAISVGGGRIRSTDCHSAGMVSEQGLDWPEKAWGYPYLGWTGDLSKVMLPLQGNEDDMPLSDDDVARIWAFRPGGKDDSVGTILFRLNPGAAGLVSAVASGVWALVSTSAFDGVKKDALELLRSAEKAARSAAGK